MISKVDVYMYYIYTLRKDYTVLWLFLYSITYRTWAAYIAIYISACSIRYNMFDNNMNLYSYNRAEGGRSKGSH